MVIHKTTEPPWAPCPLDCLQSAFSLKIHLVIISSSVIANHDVRPDEKRRTADSFVVKKPSVSPETE